MDSQLARAIELAKTGQKARARELLIAVLRENPRNVTAWKWFVSVAQTQTEARKALDSILALDPADAWAQRVLDQLDVQRGRESPDRAQTSEERSKMATMDVAQDRATEETTDQYSLAKILGIWAIVALAMPVLAFVVAPALSPRVNLHPAIVTWLMLITGKVWQFVVSLWIVYRELGTLRWSAIRERTWLNRPRDPNTGEPKARLFWWLVPAFLFVALIELGIGGFLDSAVARLFPFLSTLPSVDIDQLVQPEFVGAWWLVGLALVSIAFNYFLGEEFLFRGVLLPKMRGAFGKWDWVANAALFGLYHLHAPLRIPKAMLSTLGYTWPSRRFRSNWFAIVLHGIEALFVIVPVLAVVTGAAF